MKIAKVTAMLSAVALGLAAAGTASAYGGGHYHGGGHYYGGGRVHFGIAIGAPAYWYYPRSYYYQPYYPGYYYPPVAEAPAAPPVYIERSDAGAAPSQGQDYWYYCPESKAYYPYVKQCAGGWQRVSPQPQG